MKSITVRVPATSANLGPGFDSLGCAFALYNTFVFTLKEKPSETKRRENLAQLAFRTACNRREKEAPQVDVKILSDVPSSRGLGSSATLLVAGVMAANELLSLSYTREEIFQIAAELEGHGDNVAPAVFGGLTVVFGEKGKAQVLSAPLADGIRFCALIPDFKLNTSHSRAVLPKKVTRADAVYNLSHAAALVASLATGDKKAIASAMQDALHQPYRFPLIHEAQFAKAAALDAGAYAFCISGSGPTLLCLYDDGAFPEKVEKALAACPQKYRVLPLLPDKTGAVVLK